MSVLSEESINKLRWVKGKFDWHPTKRHIGDLVDTIDHVRAGKPLPRHADLVPACKRYLDSLGATQWPSTSWTIKGNEENLDDAAEWLAVRVRAVLKELNR